MYVDIHWLMNKSLIIFLLNFSFSSSSCMPTSLTKHDCLILKEYYIIILQNKNLLNTTISEGPLRFFYSKYKNINFSNL